MTTINIFVDEREILKANKEKYPHLHERLDGLNEEHMNDWLRLDVTNEELMDFKQLQKEAK